MSADASEGKPVPAPVLEPPKWEFKDVLSERLKLKEPIAVAKGVLTVEVNDAIVVQLVGYLDPGDMEWYGSYMPTVRIGEATSSRMTTTKDGVQFTIYPELDGDFKEGAVEFRARTTDEFRTTGLKI